MMNAIVLLCLIDGANMKKCCGNCKRWLKPLRTSACFYKLNHPDEETTPFKYHDDGEGYCDDFRPDKNRSKK